MLAIVMYMSLHPMTKLQQMKVDEHCNCPVERTNTLIPLLYLSPAQRCSRLFMFIWILKFLWLCLIDNLLLCEPVYLVVKIQNGCRWNS